MTRARIEVRDGITGQLVETDGRINLFTTWMWECQKCNMLQAMKIRGKGQYHQVCESCGKDEVNFLIS